MKPLRVRRDRVVVVPPDVVWQIVEPAETLPSWLPLGERCERLSGEGLGRRQRLFTRWGRRHATIDQEVIEYVPGERLAWRHVSEQIDGRPAPAISRETTVRVELRPAGGGTRVVLTADQVPAGFMGGLALRIVGGRRIGRAFDRALARLAGSGDER